MKNLFYCLSVCFLLASCTTDTTCTCSIDVQVPGFEIADVVSECMGCNSEEADALVAACEASDLVEGLTCVID